MSWVKGFEHFVKRAEPLAPHTWFHLGGPAEYFAEPPTAEELQALVRRARDEGVPIRLLGGGPQALPNVLEDFLWHAHGGEDGRVPGTEFVHVVYVDDEHYDDGSELTEQHFAQFGRHCVPGEEGYLGTGRTAEWRELRNGRTHIVRTPGLNDNMFGTGFIPVISSIIADRGYQAAFISTGILQGLVILIVAQFLRHPPAQPATATPVAATGTSQIGKRQFTTFEMLSTSQFYWMYTAFVLMATGGLLVTANAGPIAKSWGFSAGVLTLAATLSPLANGGSRVFWGWASDRLGRETTMVLTFVLQAICLASVVTLGQISGAWFAATLVAVYFTWGQVYSLFPSMSGDYFGTRHATSNYAVLYTAKGVASIIGPWVGARIFEQSGSWAMGFYGSAVMALVAAGIAVYLRAGSPSVRAKAAGVPATA